MERLEPGPRSGHVAVNTGNAVLVWGGYDEPFNNEKYLPANEVWLYDPNFETWIERRTAGELPPGLSGACAVVVPDEHAMYLVGGHGSEGNVNTVYRLNLRTWHWRLLPLPPMSENFAPRDKFVAWEHDRKVFIFGGYGPSVTSYLHDCSDFCWDNSIMLAQRGWNNQLLEFDVSTCTCTLLHTVGCSPSPRAAHGQAKLDSRVFIFGGRHDNQRLNDLYMYNHDTNVWTEITVDSDVLPRGRSWHSFTPISSSQIFLFGGYSNDGQPLGDAWVFDLKLVQWRLLRNHADDETRLWHTATPTADGDVIVFGGCLGDILSHEYPPEHSNSISSFRVSPCSLLRLSLCAAFVYRDVLRPQFGVLPRHLCDNLLRRMSLTSHRLPDGKMKSGFP